MMCQSLRILKNNLKIWKNNFFPSEWLIGKLFLIYEMKEFHPNKIPLSVFENNTKKKFI